ncbi:amidohydrolase family protein [Curtobacterium sp. A7_M15]|uniref:amidohydrolase family protein n=1 Tax=Curtobacterium sp. A7_M15 TaxID=3065241 RepID=UPI002737C1EB|nr:amidohydrolase family protein [Curtobacterium sp. A7_M15]MDP4332003.1 amidohydrolase family protein [Curtobacterium sp. A7_M15]
MKLTGLEEHFVTPDVLAANRQLDPANRDLAFRPASEGETSWRLLELGEERIAAMDATGLDVQVLSLTTPGVQNLPAVEAVSLQTASNDRLAEVVASRPDRFQGLATLATANPIAAADELERTIRTLGFNGAMVFGRTGDKNMDHQDFWPIYERAAALKAPLHLHPQSPPIAVREAYYAGFNPAVNAGFATFGVGWHYDAGVQFLRMIVAGVFDRFPDLQIIVGHWGELVLFFLERIQHLADVAHLQRPLIEYFRNNLYVAPSGILSDRYLRWAIDVAGADRVLFSTDYPFEAASKAGARQFLEATDITDADKTAIASGNWDRLTNQINR